MRSTHRPTHSRILGTIKLVVLPLGNILEIVNSGIIEILTGEDDVIQVTRMSVRNRMLVDIPSAEAKIKTTCSIISCIFETICLLTYP
jgi:hypothetical protein